MKKLLVSPQQLCKDIDKAIKVDKEFMYNVDAKVASMSLILPPAEKTNKKTKWGKISSCSKVYKDLKELKKAVVSYKISIKEGEISSFDECKLDLAMTDFALKFKENVKNIILNKIVAQKDERGFWDDLLNLFDEIGYQLINDSELFASLGRYSLALKKKKEKEAQEELERLNAHMQMLQQEQERLRQEKVEAEETFEPEIVTRKDKEQETERTM